MMENELYQEIPENSVFHPDNFSPVVLIQLARLYDVGMAFLGAIDPEKAKGLAELHARGEFMTPAPAFKTQED
jgi:hypothetical protein